MSKDISLDEHECEEERDSKPKPGTTGAKAHFDQDLNEARKRKCW
jgi:hypothetical protein